MKLGKWVKEKMQAWLEIVPAPSEQAIVIQRKHTRELEVLRSQLWYNGDSDELYQFFHSINDSTCNVHREQEFIKNLQFQVKKITKKGRP